MNQHDYYIDILERIDEGVWEVTKWESNFIESILTNPEVKLTSKQAEVIERMREKYLED